MKLCIHCAYCKPTAVKDISTGYKSVIKYRCYRTKISPVTGLTEPINVSCELERSLATGCDKDGNYFEEGKYHGE